ncbi:N-alpha-acetyltransferase 35, NatC auxiliary subunit-like [Epargyreus clarus]|uniref:N-alpha-acetyltransferase 35, NatC auxiliary subunit-like n=1 Tax=Epargyreus clarus TaxID=520877 RepID=UPI003C2DF097
MKMNSLLLFLFWIMCTVTVVTEASKSVKKYRMGLSKYDDAMDVADFSIYYDIKTNETIRKMMPRPWYRPGWFIRLPFRGGPCVCTGFQCKCCTGVRIQAFNFDRQTCVMLNYEPTDSLITMDVKMNNNSVFMDTFAARNPPPFCVPIPVPYLPPGLVDMCVRLFDISIVEQKLHVCMDMDTRVDKAPVLILHFDCMDMGTGGVGLSKPGGQTNISPDSSSGTTTEQVQLDSDVYDNVTENTETNSKSQSMESLGNPPEVNYNWVDITSEFFTHIQDLKLGELLHDGHLFGLFEAMSAIEMMDPKMDAGMLCNRGVPKPMNFQKSVACGKLKIDDLEPSEIIGVIDATMACIVTWLEGHSLAQTVFTNLYLHQPHSIRNKTLKSFCICVYKLLDSIRDCINKAQVFEEEDFLPMGYGYRLGSNPHSGNIFDASLELTEQRCIGMLREQEEDLNKKAKQHDDEGNNEWAALAARIRFTRMFYQALLLITKRDSNSGADCVALLNGCSETMKIILKTACLGTQPEELSEYPNPMGFEPMINQRLLPPTFPRYTRIKPRAEALQYFDELVTRLRHAWKITSCTNFHTALDFFMDFSRQRACILSRSALQLLYLSPSPAATANMAHSGISGPVQPRSQHVFVEILRDSIKNFVNPPVLSSKSAPTSPPAREFVENFLARCVRPFAVLLQVCGHNRARQRDKLALLLDEFAGLQEEAESVDAVASGGTGARSCFGTWLLYHVLRVMIAYLLSGLELELYSVHEYHYIFWYLYEFLYGWLVSALGRAEGLAGEAAKRSDAKRSCARKQKRRTKPYAREGLMCQVMQNMCGGYYKALVAFKLQGKIQQPLSKFDNEAVRYKHRFAPLSVLTPPQVHYHEFCEMTQPLQYENPVILYLGGCKHFQQARTLLETITTPDQEVTDLLKVAKTNFVVLKLLAGGHKRDSTTPPEFDFSVHRHFPIIKLV